MIFVHYCRAFLNGLGLFKLSHIIAVFRFEGFITKHFFYLIIEFVKSSLYCLVNLFVRSRNETVFVDVLVALLVESAFLKFKLHFFSSLFLPVNLIVFVALSYDIVFILRNCTIL